jgi:hypothetical protein
LYFGVFAASIHQILIQKASSDHFAFDVGTGSRLFAFNCVSISYNYKFAPIDVALTGFQGVNALSVFWKLYMCGLFIDSTMLLTILNSLVFLGFAIQWPMMLEMFAAAPLPYLHAVGELAMLVQSIALFVQWRGEKN